MEHKEIYNKQEDKKTKALYKSLADATIQNNKPTITKYQIANLIHHAATAINIDVATINALQRKYTLPTDKKKSKKLKKQTEKNKNKKPKIPFYITDVAEREVVDVCYAIGQAKLSERIIQTLLYNDKAANSIKVLAQLKGLIDTSTDHANDTIAATLNIALSKKKAKTPPEDKDKNTNNNNTDPNNQKIEPKPLTLHSTSNTNPPQEKEANN